MILQDTYEVKKADIIPVEVSVPGSKSITNRALLIAALANGKSVLKGVLFSDDSRHFLQALQDLGFVDRTDPAHVCDYEVTFTCGKKQGSKDKSFR
jgi:3-phosphoshikimate 1-carboxyvinyltransferase